MEDIGITEGPPVTSAAVLAWTLGVVGVMLVLLELFGPAETGDLGVVLALGATIIAARQRSADIVERERAAFEMGKMVGRAQRDD